MRLPLESQVLVKFPGLVLVAAGSLKGDTDGFLLIRASEWVREYVLFSRLAHSGI